MLTNKKQRTYAKSLLSCLTLCNLWTTACQAPVSMGFSSQEYWSGLPFLSAGDLPDPGIKSTSLISPALAGGFFTISPPHGRPNEYDKKFHSHKCF